MAAPMGDSLVVMAMQMTKAVNVDVVPMQFDGPRIFLARAGQLINRSRARLLDVEKERGRELTTVQNLMRCFGIIRTGAECWQLKSLAGQARVAENYMRRVLDHGLEVSPECVDTLFNALFTIEKLVQRATRLLARQDRVN